MAGKRKLTIEIAGDAKGAGKAFNEAEKNASGFGDKIGSVAKTSGLAILGIGGAAAALAPAVLTAGLKLDALAVKSETVFGDTLASVTSWAEGVAGSLGLTTAEATGAAAGIADLLKPMGFTSEKAAEMSTGLLDLSGALSAWSGGTVSATEVSDIMTSALLGETDGLKALGISISAADVAARLAKKGQQELTGAALEQAEALAIQELILEKSTDAQTAWADGSMDGVKAQNESQAAIANLKETLVQALYPAFTALLPVIQTMAEWLGDKLPAAIAWAKEAWEFFIGGLTGEFTNEGSGVLLFLNQLGMKVGEVFDWIKANVIPVFQDIAAWVQDNWPVISANIEEAMTNIRIVIETVLTIIRGFWDVFGEYIMTYVASVFEAIKTAIDAAMHIIKGVIDVVMGLITGDWGRAWDGVKAIIDGIWIAIKGAVQLAVDNLKLILQMAWDAIKATASAAWEGVKSAIVGVWEGIASAIDNIWEGIKSGVSDGVAAIVGFITSIPGKVASGIGNGFNALWDNFKGVINRIIDGINSISLPGITIGGWDPPGPGPSFPSFTTPTLDPFPHIPRLHSGLSLVPGGPSAEMLAILQGGEQVLSREERATMGANAGTTIIQFNAPVMAKQDVAAELYDMIIDGQRRGELVGSLAG